MNCSEFEKQHKLADLLIYAMSEDADDRVNRLRSDALLLFDIIWKKHFGEMTYEASVGVSVVESESRINSVNILLYSVADNFVKLTDGWGWVRAGYKYRAIISEQDHDAIDPRGIEKCPKPPDFSGLSFEAMEKDLLDETGMSISFAEYSVLTPKIL